MYSCVFGPVHTLQSGIRGGSVAGVLRSMCRTANAVPFYWPNHIRNTAQSVSRISSPTLSALAYLFSHLTMDGNLPTVGFSMRIYQTVFFISVQNAAF